MGDIVNDLITGAIIGVAAVVVNMLIGSWLAAIPGGAQVVLIATVAVGYTLAKMVKVA